MLKTPHVGEYLKHAKSQDRGFDSFYAIYSSYVHPTFGQPRDQLLEDMKYPGDTLEALEDDQYFISLQQGVSPVVSVERDIKAATFCMEMLWPKLLEMDPYFSEELGISPYKPKEA